MFGYRAEEARGKHISLVYPAEQLEFLEKQVILPLQAKGTHEVEVTLRRENGTYFPAHLSLSLLHDEEGNPKGMVGYTVDISEIKRRENELQELAAKLEASNRELESFSYSVSHDLRAPLRAIDGFSLALLEDYDDRLDDTARDYLRRVRGGAQRMGALIDDLLQLSRVNRGEIEYRTVDLSRLAEGVIEELRAGEPEREVHFEIEPGMQALGDPRLLKVVVANLLENAWKFTSHEPHATIQFRREAGEPGVFYVRDNGVGFDMRHADKLFGAFQRLHRTTDFPGTGVGLATVQRILHSTKDRGRNRLQVYAEGDQELRQRRGEMQWVQRIQRALENDGLLLFWQRIQGLQEARGPGAYAGGRRRDHHPRPLHSRCRALQPDAGDRPLGHLQCPRPMAGPRGWCFRGRRNRQPVHQSLGDLAQ